MDELMLQDVGHFEVYNDADEIVEPQINTNIQRETKEWYRRKTILILFIAILTVIGCATAIIYHLPKYEKKITKTDSKAWRNLRLPDSVLPITYDLKLYVNMDDDTYNGNVTIDINVRQQTEWILLHSVELEIGRVIISNSSQNINAAKTFFFEPNEFYVLQTAVPLQKGGNYVIVIQFKGKMRDDLSGLYTSYYNDGKIKRKVASTFFSPISARKAFPCFDEPKFKANFNLTLTHSKQYHALSNMPVQFKTYHNNQLTTKFDMTLKMSTYILCWVISDFSYIEKRNSSYPLLKAWGPKNNIKDLQYGLDVTNSLLRFYEEYFDIPYPLKKLDTIALPNLGPAAMENWGLITYRSHMILYNKTRSTEKERHQTMNVIAHELVHQWFGNLVTMEFWTDAWLKEGFANNIAILGADRIDRSLQLREQVLTNLMIKALDEDSYSSSHPISTSAGTLNEIREVFNLITYNKGSCLVEMLSQYLGTNTFRKGLQKYLATYSYKSANQDNLWEQLSNVSEKDVKSVMDTWTLQLGYPVISARRISNVKIELEQTRFTLDPPYIIPPKSPFNYIWKVPVIFENPINKTRKYYLLEKKRVLLAIPEEYSILNPDHSFFYRVHYDTEMIKVIKQILMTNLNRLSPQDRTGLISDQFNFVKAELSHIGNLLDIFRYLQNENNYFPWKVAFDSISFIQSVVNDNETDFKYNSFIKTITHRVIHDVDWEEPTSSNRRSLQVLILKKACHYGVTEKINEAKKLFSNWMQDIKMNVSPSLLPVVWDCAISHGPQSYWDFNFRKYKEGGVHKESLLMSLSTTTRRDTIKKLLQSSLDKDIIDTQDTPYLIAALAKRSRLGRYLCWEFIQVNWSYIISTYGNELFLLGNMLKAILENMSSENELIEVEMFFNSARFLGSGKQAVKQSINKIKSNIHWKRRHLTDLSNWLGTQGF